MFGGCWLWVWRIRSVNTCECQRPPQLKAEGCIVIPFVVQPAFQAGCYSFSARLARTVLWGLGLHMQAGWARCRLVAGQPRFHLCQRHISHRGSAEIMLAAGTLDPLRVKLCFFTRDVESEHWDVFSDGTCSSRFLSVCHSWTSPPPRCDFKQQVPGSLIMRGILRCMCCAARAKRVGVPTEVVCDYGNGRVGPLPSSEAAQQAMLRCGRPRGGSWEGSPELRGGTINGGKVLGKAFVYIVGSE